MKVLMFGWEFPPASTGGLGAASYGITRGLTNLGHNITFVTPVHEAKAEFMKIINPCGIKLKGVGSILAPYITSQEYEFIVSRNPAVKMYGHTLFDEVSRYAKEATLIAQNEDFDVIHAHEWLTFKAGINAKKASGKPLIAHVHATEFDRTGGNPNQNVYDLEREGLHAADLVVAVSNFTKDKLVRHYGVSPDKVKVVYNAGDHFFNDSISEAKESGSPIVLFLGRLTLQKGPDYFLEAAARVLAEYPDILFVVAGTGDMESRLIERAVDLGIADKVLFTGYLESEDSKRAYRMADLFVMPSVSEPFGLTVLEAMRSGVPVIMSRQSGVSEIVQNALKIDFWDVDQMASKILSVVHYNVLRDSLREQGLHEAAKFTWDDTARQLEEIYGRLVG